MKRLEFLLWSLIIIYSSCQKDEPEVDMVDIPDSCFLNVLIEIGVDTSKDGHISNGEAAAVTCLDFTKASMENLLYLSDMKGIEAFINLDTLIYVPEDGGSLTNLDVSENTKLLYLKVNYSKLTTLNLEKNTSLITLNCGFNQLTSLDISNCTALKYLLCRSNQLTSLDISHNPNITSLFCNNNQLTSLDVSGNTALRWLVCKSNRLKDLDISKNTALFYLECQDNQLSILDVSNNETLGHLSCGDNQLTTLDVSNNTALVELHLDNMPSLYKVCVWEMPFPPAGVVVNKKDSPNVYYTTDCSK